MELEKLLVMIILVETELICESQYLNELDRQFLIDSKNDLLLELEVLHNNTHDAFDKITNNHFHINERVFGRTLLEKLGEIYVSNQLTIHEFGAKMYLIWNSYLPLSIRDEEPFFTLCCADDCLVYGGEYQTRKLYEATFSYYKKDIA